MPDTDFGKFFYFCRDSTLPVCNLLDSTGHDQNGIWSAGEDICSLSGFRVSGDERLGNLGSILAAFFAILGAGFLLWRSERKRAAVGRREMQVFLVGFILIQICEIFSIGMFPLDEQVRIVFSAIHIGMITATTWVLMLNAVVGYQLLDDGSLLSLGPMIVSAAILFIGTGYIALDTGMQWTDQWDDSYTAPNTHYALYVLYLLVPLIFLVVFFVLETILVLRVLKEQRPMVWLTGAALAFAVGQVFNFVVSRYICEGTDGKIDGALFQTLFTAVAVALVWHFWSSITEDDWPPSTYP